MLPLLPHFIYLVVVYGVIIVLHDRFHDHFMVVHSIVVVIVVVIILAVAGIHKHTHTHTQARARVTVMIAWYAV